MLLIGIINRVLNLQLHLNRVIHPRFTKFVFCGSRFREGTLELVHKVSVLQTFVLDPSSLSVIFVLKMFVFKAPESRFREGTLELVRKTSGYRLLTQDLSRLLIENSLNYLNICLNTLMFNLV